jgi:hypothetical protein
MSAPILQKVASPALPQAREEYDRPYQDQLNNVQRLFYNRLTQSFNALISPPIGTNMPGGGYLYYPYAAIQRTTDKTFIANTATQVTFDTNDFLSACTNDGTDGIAVQMPGIYNYQFSVQFANTDSQIHTAWIWLRKNGVDIPGTASKFDVPSKHGSSDGYLIAACNFYVQLDVDDTIEMWAAVNQAYVPATTDGIYMEAYAAQTTPFAHPAIPSVVATLTFVSAV